MKVKKQRFEDAGEQDEEGRYSFYYAGFYYHFSENEEEFKARRYQDQPEEAHFTGYSVKVQSKCMARYWYGSIPYENRLFAEAVRYLVEHEGVREVNILLEGYVPVVIENCTGTDYQANQ